MQEKCFKALIWAQRPYHWYTVQSYLFLVGSNDANVSDIHRVVKLLGQLAAVEHGLYSFRWVEPWRVVAFPHFCALEQSKIPVLNMGAGYPNNLK